MQASASRRRSSTITIPLNAAFPDAAIARNRRSTTLEPRSSLLPPAIPAGVSWTMGLLRRRRRAQLAAADSITRRALLSTRVAALDGLHGSVANNYTPLQPTPAARTTTPAAPTRPHPTTARVHVEEALELHLPHPGLHAPEGTLNYDSNAEVDDGSCVLVRGVHRLDATNFASDANTATRPRRAHTRSWAAQINPRSTICRTRRRTMARAAIRSRAAQTAMRLI